MTAEVKAPSDLAETDQAQPASLRAARDLLLEDADCRGKDFCRAYTAAVDSHLKGLFDAAIEKWAAINKETSSKDISLIALGGYGRGEMSPESDLDIQLLYSDDYRRDISDLARDLWYPLWDENLKLGNSVGSLNDISLLARHEINTATTLLSVRHVAGDPKVTKKLRAKAHKIWYSQAGQWIGELLADADKRHEQFGSVAYMLEPNLKQGEGGLRDTHLMCWALSAIMGEPAFGKDDDDEEHLDHSLGSGVFSDDQEIREAYDVLLSNRIELHRVARRPEDRLLFDYQDRIAEAAGYKDARDLMSHVSLSARLIAWRLKEMTVQSQLLSGRPNVISRLRSRKGSPRVALERNWEPLSSDSEMSGSGTSDSVSPSSEDLEIAEIASQDGQSQKYVRINPDAKLEPLSVLRLAVATAELNASIDRDTMAWLAKDAPPISEPWPSEARDLFVKLLGTGRPAVHVIEELDMMELFSKLLPEWEPCRCLRQQNVYHRFTVDRHLCEAAAEAAPLVDQVERPDLLLVGSFLHDIGKGYPGDHTVVGIPLVGQIAKRMGFEREDITVLQSLVEHHLLLPDVATRRDLNDENVIKSVAEKVKTVEMLQCLAALTVADSIATSTHAWSPWKKNLLDNLVNRTETYLTEGKAETIEEEVPTAQHRSLMAAGIPLIQSGGEKVTVISSDHRGQFSEVAGVLTLNGLLIREGTGLVLHDMGLCHFLVEPTFKGDINWHRIEEHIEAALEGRLALEARLAQRTAPTMPTTGEPMISEPYVRFDNDSSDTHTVIEIGAPDSFGLLRRLAVAMSQMRLEISRVKAQSLGGSVVDSFYVQNSAQQKIFDHEQMLEIERAVNHAVSASSGMS